MQAGTFFNTVPAASNATSVKEKRADKIYQLVFGTAKNHLKGQPTTLLKPIRKWCSALRKAVYNECLMWSEARYEYFQEMLKEEGKKVRDVVVVEGGSFAKAASQLTPVAKFVTKLDHADVNESLRKQRRKLQEWRDNPDPNKHNKGDKDEDILFDPYREDLGPPPSAPEHWQHSLDKPSVTDRAARRYGYRDGRHWRVEQGW